MKAVMHAAQTVEPTANFIKRAAFMVSLARGFKMMNISTIRKSSKKILLM